MMADILLTISVCKTKEMKNSWNTLTLNFHLALNNVTRFWYLSVYNYTQKMLLLLKQKGLYYKMQDVRYDKTIVCKPCDIASVKH